MTATQDRYVDSTEQLVVEVFVRDIAHSTAFYHALGFELVQHKGTFVALTWEGHRLFLDEHPDQLPGGQPRANLRVMVADVDACWRRAQELGVAVFAPLADRGYGLRDFTILDPDGFGLRFGTRASQRFRVQAAAPPRSTNEQG